MDFGFIGIEDEIQRSRILLTLLVPHTDRKVALVCSERKGNGEESTLIGFAHLICLSACDHKVYERRSLPFQNDVGGIDCLILFVGGNDDFAFRRNDHRSTYDDGCFTEDIWIRFVFYA